MSEKTLAFKTDSSLFNKALQRSRLFQRWAGISCFVFSDFLAIVLAMGLAKWLRLELSYYMPKWFVPYIDPSFILPSTVILFAFWFLREELYSFRWDHIEESKRLVRACSMAVLCFIAILQLSKVSPSRITLILVWGFSLVLFPVLRLFAKRLLGALKIYTRSIVVFSVVPMLNVKLPFHKATSCCELLGIVTVPSKLRKVILSQYPTEVVIYTKNLSHSQLDRLINFSRRHVSSVKLVGDEMCLGHARTYIAEDFSALEIRDEMHSLLIGFIKQVVDIIVAILALIILLPLFLVIGILIKLSSPGPVIFAQKRVGKRRNLFPLYKFRSMYVDAEERLQALLDENPSIQLEYIKYHKLKNDPRITPIGKWLRKYSLDELPQLFNVIKWDMSLVGPRPYLLEEIKTFHSLRPYFDAILRVRPGMTGYQQVYHRGVPFQERVKIDSYAVTHGCLWMDITIFLKTIQVVLRGKNAY